MGKSLSLAAALALTLAVTLGSSKAIAHDDFCAAFAGPEGLFVLSITSSSFGPFGTTTSLSCVFHNHLHAGMIERESAMLLEEGAIYQPSYLASYAQMMKFESLEEAALDVMSNGVRL